MTTPDSGSKGTATSAGAIVLAEIDGALRVALAHEPDKGAQAYVLPKGHVEGDETLQEAAAREVAEEIGLDHVEMVAYLGSFERDSREDTGELVRKTIHFFLAFAVGSHEVRGGARWMTPAEAVASIPFAEDRAFVEETLRPLLRAPTAATER